MKPLRAYRKELECRLLRRYGGEEEIAVWSNAEKEVWQRESGEIYRTSPETTAMLERRLERRRATETR